MSILRKSVLASAIIGVGLVSTAGAAFAGDDPCAGEHEGHHGHHGSHSTTVNNVNDSSCESGAGVTNKVTQGDAVLGNLAAPVSAPISANICHVLDDNLNGAFSNNHASIGSGLLGGEVPSSPVG